MQGFGVVRRRSDHGAAGTSHPLTSGTHQVEVEVEMVRQVRFIPATGPMLRAMWDVAEDSVTSRAW